MTARLVAAAVVALAALAPRLAEACPFCAGADGGASVSRSIVTGIMIAMPFAVVGVAIPFVVRLVRRAERLEREGSRFIDGDLVR